MLEDRRLHIEKAKIQNSLSAIVLFLEVFRVSSKNTVYMCINTKIDMDMNDHQIGKFGRHYRKIYNFEDVDIDIPSLRDILECS